jgi:quercetin dioxygenase-like cupin family protein
MIKLVSRQYKFPREGGLMKRLFLLALCIVVMDFVSADANAQTVRHTSKILLKAPLGEDATKEVSMVSVEFPPGYAMPRHTHPGDEFAVVIQGTFELSVEGGETRRLFTGDAFHTPRGLAHVNRNLGDTPGRIVITFVTDKGKPLTTPVGK